jgi:hypothetical protein
LTSIESAFQQFQRHTIAAVVIALRPSGYALIQMDARSAMSSSSSSVAAYMHDGKRD